MPLMASKDSKETPQQMNENNVSRWPPSGAKNQTRAGLRPARRDKQADYRRKSGTPVHIIPVLLGSNTLLHEAKIISHTHAVETSRTQHRTKIRWGIELHYQMMFSDLDVSFVCYSCCVSPIWDISIVMKSAHAPLPQEGGEESVHLDNMTPHKIHNNSVEWFSY